MTIFLIALTVLISLSAFSNPALFYKLQFNAWQCQQRKEWHRVITHGFVHASFPHLLVNMFVFFVFGSNVESFFQHENLFEPLGGTVYFLILYLGGMAFATLPSFKKYGDDPSYNAVGASGAVAAVLFAHILISPTTAIYIFLIPIPIPAFIFGILYLVYERYMEKRMSDSVAHDAHFWGAIFGFAFTIILENALLWRFLLQIRDYIGAIL